MKFPERGNIACSLLLSCQEQLLEKINDENAILLNVSHDDFIEMSQVFLMLWFILQILYRYMKKALFSFVMTLRPPECFFI